MVFGYTYKTSLFAIYFILILKLVITYSCIIILTFFGGKIHLFMWEAGGSYTWQSAWVEVRRQHFGTVFSHPLDPRIKQLVRHASVVTELLWQSIICKIPHLYEYQNFMVNSICIFHCVWYFSNLLVFPQIFPNHINIFKGEPNNLFSTLS